VVIDQGINLFHPFLVAVLLHVADPFFLSVIKPMRR
jgi:hypothetical protein